MEINAIQCGNIGMSQDLSISKTADNYAFENRNIRITPIEDNTLLSITNEKGPAKVYTVEGIYKGHCIIENTLIVFTECSSGPYSNNIYKIDITKTGTSANVSLIYEGNLNLGDDLDFLSYYESKDIRKVYWVDGKNSPRYINIDRNYKPDESLDFLPVLNKFTNITVSKDYTGEGKFEAGVIQYAITYYNKFGAETAISTITPLIYITDKDSGTEANSTVSCNLVINITNADTSFDYIRLYSIKRTTLNGPYIVSIVKDTEVTNPNFTIIDNNYLQENVDPNLIYFLGGSDFVASTIAQKDNTLFLGDITTKGTTINKAIENHIKSWYTTNSDGFIECNKITEVYEPLSLIDYKSNDSYYIKDTTFNNGIKGFKCGEIYRFAIQFQSKRGQWSSPVFIGDKKATLYPKTEFSDSKLGVSIPIFKFNASVFFDGTTSHNLLDIYKDIRSYRILMAETSQSTRSIVTQGIISPTIFNYKQRCDNAPYVLSSPIMRDNTYRNWANLSQEIRGTRWNQSPENEKYTKKDINLVGLAYKVTPIQYNSNGCTDIECSFYASKPTPPGAAGISYSVLLAVAKATGKDTASTCVGINKKLKEFEVSKRITEDEINAFVAYCNDSSSPLPAGWGFSASDAGGYDFGFISVDNTEKISTKLLSSVSYFSKQSEFFIDSSIVTLHSPELETEEININEDNLKFRIVGISLISANKADALINVDNQLSVSAGVGKNNVEKYNYPNISNFPLSLTRDKIYIDSSWSYSGDKIFPNENQINYYDVYMWDKTGSIIGQTDGTYKNSSGSSWDGEKKSVIKNKIIANRRFSYKNTYFTPEDINITNVKTFNSTSIDAKKLNILNKDIYYYGNYDFLNTYSEPYVVYYLTNNKITSYDPVRIKYKSTPHAVFGLLNGDKTKMLKLPDLSGEAGESSETNKEYLWLSKIFGGQNLYDQLTISQSKVSYPRNNYLFIGELYRDLDYSSLYGGSDIGSLEKIKWIPAGGINEIPSSFSSMSPSNIYGDTFYNRYDCLKTYPYTEEDQNSIVDITSVMLETHLNIAAKSDNIKDNILNLRPYNSNKINPVYNQKDNVFTYSILDSKFKEQNYPNQVVWSLQKTPKENVDNWTNVTLSAAIDLDGDKGKITKLIGYQDKLLAFQPKAVSIINYNNKTALSTVSGSPIEIINSGLVNGYTNISDTYGLTRKKEIIKAASGLYFLDTINKQFLCFNNEGLSNISSHGMSQWFKECCTYDSIKDKREKLFTLNYDALTNDVYLVNFKDCLVYNELLKSFTSFLPYNNTLSIFNISGYSYILKDNSNGEAIDLYKMFEGEYNRDINGSVLPYSVLYRIKPSDSVDSVFTNVEFNADVLDSNYKLDTIPNNSLLKELPFDYIEVWNEYQYGKSPISLQYTPSNIKQKYRRWRLDIPRDANSKYGLDRIRNPWCYIKLEKREPENSYKLVFHNMLVKYYK